MKLVDKLEDYLLSEKALDLQFMLFIVCVIVVVINILFFGYSLLGFYIALAIFSLMTIDIALTVFVIMYRNTIKIKKGDD